MVGVPGRSRACQSCRKRKISCDQKTPRCGPCERLNKPCDFSKPRVFVVNDQGSHKAIYRKNGTQGVPAHESNIIPGDAPPGPADDCGRAVEVAAFRTLSFQRINSTPHMLRQITSCAIFDFDKVRVSDVSPSQIWAKVITTLASSPDFADAPLLAFYVAWRAREVGDPVLQEVGRELYVRGLGYMRWALRDSRTALKDATLASCLALLTYEVLECPNGSNEAYLSHADGCQRLLRLRGPERHQEGVGHQIFVSFRILGIQNSLGSRRPSFLLSHDWMTIPWAIHEKNVYDRLLDILGRIPDMLLKTDLLHRASPDKRLAYMDTLWEDCLEVDDALRVFYENLTAILPAPLYWEEEEDKSQPAVVEVGSSDDAMTTEKVFNFSCREAARTLTLYWAIQAMILAGMTDLCEAYRTCGLEVPEQTTFLSLAGEPRWLLPIRNVCQSITYCLSTPSFYSGSLQIATALNFCIKIMANRTGCEREYELALHTKRNVIGKRWFRIHQF